MENETLFNKFELLPIEAQRQVLAFIEFLSTKYEIRIGKKSPDSIIGDDKFIGMWKDRKEYEDSSNWVNEIRKSNWRENF